MSNNNIKEKKAAKLVAEKKEDVKLYRLMLQLVLSILAIFAAIKAESSFLSKTVFAMPTFLLITGILFALSAILFTVKKKNRTDESDKVITSALIFGNIATLFSASVMLYLYWDVKLVIAYLITATVLYFAHNIYGGNFFAYSLITAVGYISLQLADAEPHILYYLGLVGVVLAKALVFAVPVIAILLGFILVSKKKNYTFAGITIGGKKYTFNAKGEWVK